MQFAECWAGRIERVSHGFNISCKRPPIKRGRLQLTVPSNFTHELTAVDSIDIVAYAVYSGHPICHVGLEGDRVRFYLPTESVDSLKNEIATGRAHLDLARWQSVLRQIRRDWLSVEAKVRLRAELRQQGGAGR